MKQIRDLWIDSFETLFQFFHLLPRNIFICCFIIQLFLTYYFCFLLAERKALRMSMYKGSKIYRITLQHKQKKIEILSVLFFSGAGIFEIFIRYVYFVFFPCSFKGKVCFFSRLYFLFSFVIIKGCANYVSVFHLDRKIWFRMLHCMIKLVFLNRHIGWF